jgi:hypothetical protein
MVCPNLKYYELLKVGAVEEAEEGQLLKDLHFKFPNLFSVKIESCDEIQSLDGLKTIPVVFIGFCEELRDISGLGENKSVYIEECIGISNFMSLKNIPKVTIKRCPIFSNGHEVENVGQLTLSHLSNFKDAKMLGNVRQLKIIQCRQLNSFEGLSNVNDLEFSFITFSELRHLGGPKQMRLVIHNFDCDFFERNGSSLSVYSDYDYFRTTGVFLRKQHQQRPVATTVPMKNNSKRNCSIM